MKPNSTNSYKNTSEPAEPGLRIAPVEETDFQTLTAWITAEFPYFKTDPNHYRKRMLDKPIETYKLEKNARMIGYIEIEYLTPDVARINGLGVEPDKRNNGYGTHLIHFALQRLNTPEITTVLLLVHPKNQIAKRMYAKHGFTFKRMFDQTISGEIVEEWQKHPHARARPAKKT